MKYEKGDKVLIKDINWYNKNKDEDGVISCGEFIFVSSMSKFCGKILTIDVDFEDGSYLMKEDTDGFVFTNEMFDTFAEEEVERLTGNLSNSLVNEFELPDGYIFKDENGNIINAQKIVLEKKKKEYPKTYEECCEVLGIPNSSMVVHYCRSEVDYEVALSRKLFALQKLLICRDAYWKIAGDKMGLGRSWEPSGNEDCFIISRSFGEVFLFESAGDSETFEFPTREMRDAFYENFKKEIEICKELL